MHVKKSILNINFTHNNNNNNNQHLTNTFML